MKILGTSSEITNLVEIQAQETGSDMSFLLKLVDGMTGTFDIKKPITVNNKTTILEVAAVISADAPTV